MTAAPSISSSRHFLLTPSILGLMFVFSLCAICHGQAAAVGQVPQNNLDPMKADIEGGHFARADGMLHDLLAGNPADVEARYLLAYVLFKEDKPADSLKEYTEAARRRTPTAKDLKTVALDYVLLNDYSDAQHWIRYALSIDANDAQAWYEAGRIEYTLNHFQDALKAFDKALLLEPASVKTEDNRGLALEALNRRDEALAAYRKAIAMQTLSPHPSEQPLLNLGTLLISRNQLDEALTLLRQAQQIAPRDSKILAQLGRVYSAKGDWSAARTVLEEAIQIEPERASLHFQLGQVYRKSGEAEKAEHEFTLVRDLLGNKSTPLQ